MFKKEAPLILETLPSGAPSSFSNSESSFVTRIQSFQNEHQGSGRTVIPNAFAWNKATSSSNPTYIVDTSGQRVDTSNPHDLEPLFESPTSDSSALTDAEREALTNLLITRGANPFAPIVKPNNSTSVETSEGLFDSIEQIQQNPLGTGSGLSRENEFDYSTIGDNPFRPALENLPENGATPSRELSNPSKSLRALCLFRTVGYGRCPCSSGSNVSSNTRADSNRRSPPGLLLSLQRCLHHKGVSRSPHHDGLCPSL